MARQTKHMIIFDTLHKAILNGTYRPGDQLPTEHQLVEQFSASRPTIARALRDLQFLNLIERKSGAGTFVKARPEDDDDRKLFGLLIPGLGQTEIFEPICARIAKQTHANQHTLIWGDFSTDKADPSATQILRVCRDFIAQNVAGVYYAPVELADEMSRINKRIIAELERNNIAVILLDRDIVRFPLRSGYDVVGIDNRQGGFLLTNHLINLGCRNIGFLAKPNSASTVDCRVAGYCEAMTKASFPIPAGAIQFGDPDDSQFVRDFIVKGKLEAVLCANDFTAAHLMHTLHDMGMHVPNDIRVVGFDDVKYAKLVRVPLTTISQPTNQIGQTAVAAMHQRINSPFLPARTIALEPKLIVRKSCGSV